MAGFAGYPGFITDFFQGTAKKFVIHIRRKLPNGTYEDVDLTGSKFYVTLARDRDTTTAPDIEVTIDPPTDPTHGKTVGEIQPAQSMAVDPGLYYYTVRWISGAADPIVIDAGCVKIMKAVSNRVT